MDAWEGNALSHGANLSPAITGEFHQSGPEREFFISGRQTGVGDYSNGTFCLG